MKSSEVLNLSVFKCLPKILFLVMTLSSTVVQSEPCSNAMLATCEASEYKVFAGLIAEGDVEIRILQIPGGSSSVFTDEYVEVNQFKFADISNITRAPFGPPIFECAETQCVKKTLVQKNGKKTYMPNQESYTFHYCPENVRKSFYSKILQCYNNR